MSYQEFLQEVCIRLQGEFGEAELSCFTISAVNREKEGIIIKHAGANAAPVVYFEDVYQDYKRNGDMESCMNEAVKRIQSYLKTPVLDDVWCGDIFSWEKISEYLYPFLVSAERNQSMLHMMKHRKFLDLSICYMLRLPVKDRTGYSGIVRVTCDLADVWGCSEEALYRKAMENARKEGYFILGMEEVFPDLLRKEMPEETDLSNLFSKNRLGIMSNHELRYGAAGILDTKLLEKFARECGADFYIIPSSIHEVLLLPDDGGAEAEQLNDMVRWVNADNLAEEEILSDHVYYYSRAEGKIRCC